MRHHTRRMIRIRLEDQYVVDAAGFWLDRFFARRSPMLGEPLGPSPVKGRKLGPRKPCPTMTSHPKRSAIPCSDSAIAS